MFIILKKNVSGVGVAASDRGADIMIKILVAEDDKALCSLVSSALRNKGYEVTAVHDGGSAYDAFVGGSFDMIVTDVMMPVMDGFALAEKVREASRDIPLLFMTALDDKPSKMLGYRIGIDDYIVKPFDTDELVLRIGAVLRRARINASREITAGNLRMDLDEHTAYVGGKELPLTVREFDLLYKLLSYPKKTFTRAQLMDEFWDYDSSATSRTVDVYMAKLREKTAECDGFEILTVHGLGYRAVLK